MRQPRRTGIAFLAGLMLGLVVYHGALIVSGQTTVNRDFLDEQQARLDLLQEENLELTEELFQPRVQGGITFSQDELPYDAQADAASMVSWNRLGVIPQSRS